MSEPVKQAVVETKKLFRRKPLLVEAEAQADGSWVVAEAGRIVEVGKDDFLMLYEAVELVEGQAVDAGLPDMEPGTVIDRGGQRLMRVTVIAGRGGSAYWHQNKPRGQDCGFQVIADMINDPLASHYAGKFVEPWEGGGGTVGLKRTWVRVGG